MPSTNSETAATTAGSRSPWRTDHRSPVFGDPTRLHQLIGNLLSNAVKFRPHGGQVHVVVDAVDAFGARPSTRRGTGHPRSRAPTSSSSGSTGWPRRPNLACPGTGLGLAIAKSVAEAHEGFVDIVDTPGWSTTFPGLLAIAKWNGLERGAPRWAPGRHLDDGLSAEKRRGGLGRGREPNVGPGAQCWDTAPRRALQQAALQEVWLVSVFDGVGLLFTHWAKVVKPTGWPPKRSHNVIKMARSTLSKPSSSTPEGSRPSHRSTR